MRILNSMGTAVRIPERLAQRKELTEDLRVPASWASFLELVEQADYRLEYDDGQIISLMGYGSEAHELLVAQMIFLLKSLLAQVDMLSGYTEVISRYRLLAVPSSMSMLIVPWCTGSQIK